MAERTCTVGDCQRAHLARGMCSSHYGTWHRKVNGRTRNATTFPIVCIVCGADHLGARRETKFCSNICKGRHYSLTRATKCKLPADHPVMVLLRESREVKPKPAKPDLRTPRQCPGCACWFSPLKHCAATQMVSCSPQCAKRVTRRRRRAREHGAQGSWTWAQFMSIARKFGYCCAYCGEKPERLDPDHVVPLSRGGSDSPSNLLPSCFMCNSSKCAMTLPEWQAWREAHGQSERATSWAPGDPKYTHLTEALLVALAA